MNVGYLVLGIIIGLVLGASIVYFILNLQIDILSTNNDILQSILKSELAVGDATPILMKAEYYYDLASNAYENDEFADVELYCGQSKTYYTDAEQKLRDTKAGLEIDHPVIEAYKGILDENIVMTIAMFQACEHFESASRYYAKDNWEMGGTEIEAMNEQITIHDNAVGRYNNYYSELKLELNKLIEK